MATLQQKQDVARWRILEDSIRGNWDIVQRGQSLQQNFTPARLVRNMLEQIGSLKDKDVLIVANSEILLYLTNLKHHPKFNGNDDFNYKSLTLLTDSTYLEGKRGDDWKVVVEKFNNVAKIDMGMKFDVVIGNPPYQTVRKSGTDSDRNLWLTFLNWSYDKLVSGGKLVFVTPPSFIGKKTRTKKADYSVFLDKQVDSVCVLSSEEGNKFFPGVGSKFCHYCITKGEKTHSTILKINNSNVNIDLNNTIAPPVNGSELNIKLFNFINSHKRFEFLSNYECHSQKLKNADLISEEQTRDMNVPVIVSNKITRFTSFRQTLYNRPKVLLACVSTIDKCKFSCEENFGEDMKYIEVGSREEGNNLLSIFTSKLYRYIGANFRVGRNINRDVFPALPIDKEWSDQEIYEYFELTQDEINLIEDSIK